MHKGSHCLFAHRRGLYEICIDGVAPYNSSRATGVTLLIPYAVKTELHFAVEDGKVDIAAEPSLAPVIEVFDPSLASGSKREALDEGTTDFFSSLKGSYTQLHAKIPPTHKLMIQWTEKIEIEEEGEGRNLFT